MATLQIREVPETVYEALTEASKQARRSLTQQTLVTLERGLGLDEAPQQRRRRIISAVRNQAPIAQAEDLPSPEALVREDRDR